MKVVVISAFSKLVENFLDWGIVAQAAKRGLVEIECINLRDFADNTFGHIDDRPYGGGPGMVLKYQPLRDAIKQAKSKLPDALVCYMSPQGKSFDQAQAWRLSRLDGGLILVCGRYEGIDERVIDRWVDEQISIGPYVLSGGEIAASVVIEACARLIPGAVGDEQSIEQESHSDWSRFDHPHYTRPADIDGMAVPPVLLGGNHSAIDKWRQERRRRKIQVADGKAKEGGEGG